MQRPLGRAARESTTTLVDEVQLIADEHPELDVDLAVDDGAAVPAHLEPLAQSVFAEAVTNALKPATTETGLVVQVPNFINAGDLIRVDTETGAYLQRGAKGD